MTTKAVRAPDVSDLLRAWGQGDVAAREEVLPLVYQELRRRALAHLRTERADHTLQPTALVHEAYLRLAEQRRVVWQNRAHFFATAAQMMRRILVDHARARARAKRLGGGVRVALDEGIAQVEPPDCDVLQLDLALEELSAVDPQQGRIVELRYFGGLTESQVAEALALSRSTVSREWRIAKGWLYRRVMNGHSKGPAQ